MIDINKKYRTRDGRPVRILAVGLAGAYPVAAAITEKTLGESLAIFNENGRFINHSSSDNNSDLVEVGPYDDFEIDDLVMAKLLPSDTDWKKRYFAGVSESGRPLVFLNGLTKWSSDGRRVSCYEVRQPTDQEIAVIGA